MKPAKVVLGYDFLISNPEVVMDEEERDSLVKEQETTFIIPELTLFALAAVRDLGAASKKQREIASEILMKLSGEDLPGLSVSRWGESADPESFKKVLESSDIPTASLHWIVDHFGKTSPNHAAFSDGQTEFELATVRPEFIKRAKNHGILIFEYEKPSKLEYTGFRHVAVPYDILESAATDGLDANMFYTLFPLEPELLPNEYLILYEPSYDMDSFVKGYSVAESDGTFTGRLDIYGEVVQNTKFRTEDYSERILRYDAETERFVNCHRRLYSGLPANWPELAAYTDALNCPDIDVLVIQGPAGSGKTYTATQSAFYDCQRGDYSCTTIFAPGESDIGALPGELSDKMAPQKERTKDVLRAIERDSPSMKKKRDSERKFGCCNGETLKKKHSCSSREDYDSECQKKSAVAKLNDVVDMQFKHYFDVVPHEFVDGRDFKDQFIIIDEAQRLNYDLMFTAMTRHGQDSKMVIIGDTDQSTPYGKKLPEVDGITYAAEFFKGGPMVAQFKLFRCVRSAAVAYGLSRVKEVNRKLFIR